MRSRNIIFSFCVCVVLMLCMGHIALRAACGLSDDPARSYLEGRTYQAFPELTVETIAKGSFQSQFEQYVADMVPMRDDVMLLNAGLQRSAIVLANAPLGFSAYPTFFGSDYLCCPAYEAVVETPSTQRVLSADALEEAAELFTAAIGRHDRVRWQFALVDRSRNSSANPAHDLVAQPADYQFCVSEFLDKLPESCGKPDLSVADADEYFRLFYRTDHHWRIEGALAAYTALLEGFGFEPADDFPISTQFEVPFYGANDRSGLSAEFYDSVDDVSMTLSIRKVVTDGKKRKLSWLNERLADGYAGYKKAHRFENVYADYFHGDAGLLEIEADSGEGSLLIVGDSFTNCVDYLFANQYRHVYVIDPRHYTETLDSFMQDHEIDDAVIIMGSNTVVAEKTAAFLKSAQS